MTASIVDAFDAMGRMSGDPSFGQLLQKNVAAALSGPENLRERGLINAFIVGEREFLRRSSGERYADDLRRETRPHFQDFFSIYPHFALLFEPHEKQLLALSGSLLRAVAKEARVLIGPKVVETVAQNALKGTTWSTIKVTLSGGIEYNPTRVRNMQESVTLVSTLFEGWMRLSGAVLGTEPGLRCFERAYADVAKRYDWLPVVKNLLGATPLDVLQTDKAKQLHALELETSSQAMGLRAADEGLRRQAERLQQTVTELEATKQKLEIVSQAKSAFIDVVSHQFRTPLSSVRWNAEMLYDELAGKKGVDPVHVEAIANIRTKSVYLTSTLDRVFTTLEIDTGTIVIDKKQAFLWEVVQDVRAQYDKDIASKNIKWTFKRAKEQVKEIPLDKTKIEAVLKILIGNSVAYTNDGGRITVDIKSGEKNGKSFQVCSVTDDGLGLPAADVKKFFDKFYRSKSAVLKVADGTGLGNYIVKHLVEDHGGYVTVESDGEGKGTTVTFGLPVA